MWSSVAIAVFVKNPMISPVKTRLMEGIGKKNAEEFYHLSCRSIYSVVSSFNLQRECDRFWAVAEDPIQYPEGADYWRDWPIIYQGGGGLGDRLHQVYGNLQSGYEAVIILGSDCPQLSSSLLWQTLSFLEKNDYVLGPAADGGFYLFAGKKKVPESVWVQTPYSSHDTFKILSQNLVVVGQLCSHLPVLHDVDDVSCLAPFQQELNALPFLVESQYQLKNWVESLE